MGLAGSFAFIALCLAANIVHGLIQFINAGNNENIQAITKLLTFAFLSSTLFLMLFYVPLIFILENCYKVSEQHYQIILLFWIIFFVIHSLLLVIIFFCKLKSVFATSRYKLSQGTVNFYKTLFIISPILCLTSITLSMFKQIAKIYLAILMALFLLLYIGTMISIVTIFIRKLILVYNNDKLNNESLINAITKSTILTSISLFLTLLHIITNILISNESTDTYFTEWLNHYITIGDIYTNFVCVILCFKSFQGCYDKVCVAMDNKCHSWWRHLLNFDEKMVRRVTEEDQNEVSNTEVTVHSPETVDVLQGVTIVCHHDNGQQSNQRIASNSPGLGETSL